jgi:hypothetical protein
VGDVPAVGLIMTSLDQPPSDQAINDGSDAWRAHGKPVSQS